MEKTKNKPPYFYEKRIIALTFLLKISYFLAAIFATYIGICKIPLTANPYSWLYIFCGGDTLWYHSLYDCGYEILPNLHDFQTEQYNYAFFPLYPLAIKALAWLTQSSFFPAAFLFSLFLSPFTFLLFFRVMQHFVENEKEAFQAVLALMLFPFHFFFSVYYTECLFLALMMGGYWSILNKKWGILALCIAGLALTRPNGIVTAFALYLFYLWQSDIFPLSRFFQQKRPYYPYLIAHLAFACGLAALAWHCHELYTVTGDYFIFSKAAAAWGRKTTLPFASLFNQGILAVQVNSVFCIIYTLIALFGLRKFPFPLQFLVWINLLLIVSTGQMISIP
ncbi:MAG: hypothetical protein ACKVTZ_13385, partial [Bacteroidia bacterium]